MDTDSDYDDNENDDSELIQLLMNEKKDKISADFTNLQNVPFEHANPAADNRPRETRFTESPCIISSDEETGEEIIREMELIAPATSETNTGDHSKLNNMIVNCIQDENVKNNIFRLNEQLENNITKCRIVAAEAKTTLAEKMALIRECKKIEDKILKYSVEEAKLKKIKKKKGKDCAETGHNKITYFCRFGIPYFKSKQRFPADQNYDYKEITRSNQATLSKLPKMKRFLKKDAQTLDSLVLQQLKGKRIDQLKAYLRDLNRSIETHTSDNNADELYERKKKIYDAIIETNMVSNLDYTKDWNLTVNFSNLIKEGTHRYGADDYERMWNLLANPLLSREDFSAEETNRLKMLVDQVGAQDWDRIAQLLGTGRSGFMCFTKYVTTEKKGKNVPWTPAEDDLLRNLCSQLRNIKKPGSRYHWWRNIRRHFPNRTYPQIHAHWSYVLAPRLKKGRFSDDEHNAVEQMVKDGKRYWEIAKIFGNRTCVQIRSHYEQKCQFVNLNSGPWTRDEENMLLELIREHGDKNWVKISRHMKTRTRIQCRLKYLQFRKHRPQIESPDGFRKGRWSEEENELFIQLIERYGRKWSVISRIMKTRSRFQCSFKFMNDLKIKKMRKENPNFGVVNDDDVEEIVGS